MISQTMLERIALEEKIKALTVELKQAKKDFQYRADEVVSLKDIFALDDKDLRPKILKASVKTKLDLINKNFVPLWRGGVKLDFADNKVGLVFDLDQQYALVHEGAPEQVAEMDVAALKVHNKVVEMVGDSLPEDYVTTVQFWFRSSFLENTNSWVPRMWNYVVHFDVNGNVMGKDLSFKAIRER